MKVMEGSFNRVKSAKPGLMSGVLVNGWVERDVLTNS
jgi:hypothetical protein